MFICTRGRSEQQVEQQRWYSRLSPGSVAAPVIQATGRLRLADRLSSGLLGCSGLCRSAVRTNGAFPRYGSLLGGFPLGTVPGTWYFFSTTSVEVPCEPYRYQNVTCKLCWSLIGLRKSSLLRHWTCDTRPSSTVLPARFKSAQPAKDRTQLLFKQTQIFASTTK